jgi:PAS domain S-box-containing protein
MHESIAFAPGDAQVRRKVGGKKIMSGSAQEADTSDSDIARVLAHTPDAMVVVDESGTIVIVNPQAELLFGFVRSELEGQPVEKLIPGQLRDAHRKHRAAFSAAPRPRPMGVGGDLHAVRKDGSEFPVEVSLSPMKRGAQTYAVAAIRDVSERKRNEQALRRAEEQLRQVQRMEAVGKLAGGVAHDFNNLLSVILRYANLLLESVGDHAVQADIEEIRRAAERAADLTRQLLAFSRKQMLEPKVVSLGAIVLDMERLLRRLLGDDIDLALIVPSSDTKVFADPMQLEVVVMNLAVNARDAMPEGGKLTIETAEVYLDAEYVAHHAGATPGPHVMLAVSDAGAGMDDETRARVFEPFFTTKELGKGTGLGLSTVYGIVRQSCGHVWIHSKPGNGTTFNVYLPVTGRTPERALAAQDDGAATVGGSETVLLVEDQEQVRTLVHSVLKRHGYHVLEANDAAHALVLSDRYPSKIDLLLTDVVMPQMSGRQLADRLVDRRREMKVLYMSGYTDNSVIRRGVLESDVAFLQKPLTPASLLRKVRKVLDA